MFVLLALFACAAVVPAFQALNANKTSLPQVNKCFRSVAYWGQDSLSTRPSSSSSASKFEKPLDAYCNDDTFDIIMVSFLDVLYHGKPALPGIELSRHCYRTPFKGYPRLLQCPEVASSIKKCQSRGKTIMLSMGGAGGKGEFKNEKAGREYADIIWKMFLGGQDKSIPRPFGDAVMDGVDLDIEHGPPTGYGSFVLRLRELYDTDPKKTYYISAAPECMFPNEFIGPTGKVKNAVYALKVGWFDFLFVQFYNNYCGLQSFGKKDFNFGTWNNWARNVSTQIFLGVPGDRYAAGTGYQPATKVKTILKSLIKDFGPQNGGWFGGYMTWDAGVASANFEKGSNTSFAREISQFLKQNNPSGTQCRQ